MFYERPSLMSDSLWQTEFRRRADEEAMRADRVAPRSALAARRESADTRRADLGLVLKSLEIWFRR